MVQAHVETVDLTMRTRAEVVIGLVSSDVQHVTECPQNHPKTSSGHWEGHETGQHIGSPRSDDGGDKHTACNA